MRDIIAIYGVILALIAVLSLFVVGARGVYVFFLIIYETAKVGVEMIF